MTTGSQVISDNAQAAAQPGFFTDVLGALAGGIRGFIDIELAERAGSVPDQADLRSQVPAADPGQPEVRPLFDTLTALTPLQIGGLVVAAGLAWGLATGKFG